MTDKNRTGGARAFENVSIKTFPLSKQKGYATKKEHSVDVYANTNTFYENDIDTKLTHTNLIAPAINHSGNLVYLEVLVSAKSAVNSSGTMYLQRLYGSSWISIKSWNFSSNQVDFVVQNTYWGTNGATYRTKIVANVGADYFDIASNPVTIN